MKSSLFCSKFLPIASIVFGLVLSPKVFASTISPVWSADSESAAKAKCTAGGGKVVGHSMETTTADQGEFYIVACVRPVDGGSTYVPAWSAENFANAKDRCETDSATTGLPAGQPVGTNVYASSSTSDIFIVICSK